jgi:hypothetical protein
VVDKNEDGTIKKNVDGTDKLKEVEKFPLSWTNEHFERGTDVYLTADSSLSVEETWPQSAPGIRGGLTTRQTSDEKRGACPRRRGERAICPLPYPYEEAARV